MSNITSAESDVLLAYLNGQCEHVLGILRRLTQQDLQRPVLPSGWTCLVHHLVLDVEQFWFRAVVAGEQAAITSLAGRPNAWQINAETPATAGLDLYRQESDRANSILAATPLDRAPAWWSSGLFGDWQPQTVREIVYHGMTETACHAGHLDATRELIDGRRWRVLNP